MTIEERAERYACDELPECRDDVRDGYIQGATDQYEIDKKRFIDKAFDFIYKHFRDAYGKFLMSTDDVDDDGIPVKWVDIFEDEFREMFEKAMRE